MIFRTRVPVWVCSIALLSGCDEASSSVPADAARDPDAAVTEAGEIPEGCSGERLADGDHDYDLEFEAAIYRVRIHVPPGYDLRPTPAVLNVHGAKTTIAGQQIFTGLNADADARGYLVLYPGSPDQFWNGGVCCGTASETDRDDVGFIRAMIEDVRRRVCLDDDRVYVTGHSNGALFAYRLACEASDLFAAFAPVAGTMSFDQPCHPDRPLPILHFHGTEDRAVPFEGNDVFQGVLPMIEEWAERNGCTGIPVRVTNQGEAMCDAYSACRGGAEVAYCTIGGMGHCWPGQPALCSEPLKSTDLSANETMLDFFDRFVRP